MFDVQTGLNRKVVPIKERSGKSARIWGISKLNFLSFDFISCAFA